jgi:hypothetical protein
MLERLAELARLEEAAVDGRRWDDLLEIQGEQRELLASLPQPLPDDARPSLELALTRARATERTLFASLAETKGTIERLRGSRRTVGAYGVRSLGDLEAEA